MKSLLVVLLLTASTAHGEIYTWKDPHGTAHFTNSMDEIPVRYRDRIKVLTYETEQKKDPSAPQQNSRTQPVPPPDQPAGPMAGGTLIQQNTPFQPITDKPKGVQLNSNSLKSEKRKGRRNAANRTED